MENVVKCGYLECHVRGVGCATFQWQKRFYVLYSASSTNKGRLDYYDNENSYRTEPKVRKTIYLEEVREALPEKNSDRCHTFQLYMCRSAKRSYRFAAACESNLHEWLKAIDMAQEDNLDNAPGVPSPFVDDTKRIFVDQNAICESAEDLQQYEVQVQETEAAKRCHLKISTPYDLYIMSDYLCLTEKNKRIITWNYKHIRRYGCGESNFTFEAGRKSLSGEGLFSFSVKHGQLLFQNVQDRMKHLLQKPQPEKDKSNKLPCSGVERPSGLVKNVLSDELSPKPMEANLTAPLPPVRRTSASSEGAPISPLPQKPKTKGLPFFKPKIVSEKKLPTSEALPVEKPRVMGFCNTGLQSELNSKLAERNEAGAQLLKPQDLGKPQVSERKASLPGGPPSKNTNSDRISKGENYELAKSTLPMSAQRKLKPGDYSDSVDERVLDTNYSRTPRVAPLPPVDPEYATYDICGSSRFQGNKPVTDYSQPTFCDDTEAYSEPVLPRGIAWRSPAAANNNNNPPPLYDTPAEADVSTTVPKFSEIIGKLPKKKKEQEVSSEYDHIALQHQLHRPVPTQGYYDHVVNQPRKT